MKEKYTPMMMQYLEIKEQYQDAIVMFRLGDFYEMFFEDAKTASKVLEIALTGRDAGTAERVPMCGVPFHAVNGYIQRLIDKGYKVAIVEQLTQPGVDKIVKRGVIQVITPGTVMEDAMNFKENNFIACYVSYEFNSIVGFADISTGETSVMAIDKNEEALIDALLSNNIKELVVLENEVNLDHRKLQENYHILISFASNSDFKEAYKPLFKQISDMKMIKTMSILFNYLVETQKRELPYLQEVRLIENTDYLNMDVFTKNSLELLTTIRQNEKYGSLFWLLDHTKCAMGSRLLKQWIDKPLIEQTAIEKRLDLVELLIDNYLERESLKEILKDVYDLERLAARVAYGNVNPRDIKWIGTSLKVIPELRNQLQALNHPLTNELLVDLVDLSETTDLIDRALVDNPPINLKDGGLIRSGYSALLDEFTDARDHGKQWILEFEAKEKERTGIKNLKIGYNRVFGYYIEVTKSYLSQIKDEFLYTRKQSLANAERFITPELKEMENKILSAEDKITKLEYQLFTELRDELRKVVSKIQQVAGAIAKIDAYQSLAVVSSQNGYVRPTFNHDHVIDISEGKHAVINEVMKKQRYVENDIYMDQSSHVLMITGPNMGGKSTYMRQITLTIIMAQIGCYVCAASANLPIVDKIFTRIGASDDLISGQSTFMVEMLEANKALQGATENSLIVFDEIGRGTATYDGMAIAQAIIEYIVNKIHCLTLFSTHYHELTELESTLGNIKNVHASVSEDGHDIIFLYKVKPGKANKSYGVNVAKLAHLPDSLLYRANDILMSLENNTVEIKAVEKTEKTIEKSMVELYLDKIDPMSLSPLDALSTLIELKNMAGR
ncbi:DNA mismatch repair protein MutS [Beduini massiliensis]|uniref:DNA mismatch repair protein MutS n=1 Tax=Beduini massiliensis TaxID=1585974 RepID=UPI00059A8A3F|nr:DNA mismatch repair protein MutS [Beduini massiliensis]